MNTATLESPDFARDPFPYYARWREAAPVHHVSGADAWMVLTYDDACVVLKQPDVFSSSPNSGFSPSLNGALPVDHHRMRRILQPLFSPELQLGRKARVVQIVRERIDELKRRKRFDGIVDFTAPVAMSIACDWLGLDVNGADAIRKKPVPDLEWMDIEGVLVPAGLIEKLGVDTALDKAVVAELAGFFIMAGVETAREFALFALLSLSRQREAVDAAIADPSTIPAMTEELLRLEPPAHVLVRRTTRDVALSGQEIPAGSKVWISVAAANRDPSVFQDPDDLIPGRKGHRHLSFGIGAHFCLGSHLGRMEGETILGELMPHVPALLNSSPDPVVRFVGPDGAPSLRQIVEWQLSLR